MVIGIIIAVMTILSIPTVVVVGEFIISHIPFGRKNKIIEDRSYRNAVRDKYFEIEKYFRDKLNSLPKYNDINRVVKISSYEFDYVVNNTRGESSCGILIRDGLIRGGIYCIVNGYVCELNDKEKEWIILNFETVKEKFDNEFDELGKKIATKMEDDEAKMFKVMGMKIPSL